MPPIRDVSRRMSYPKDARECSRAIVARAERRHGTPVVVDIQRGLLQDPPVVPSDDIARSPEATSRFEHKAAAGDGALRLCELAAVGRDDAESVHP